MKYLKKISIVIFLDTPLSFIKKHLKNKNKRGIVGLKSKSLEKIYKERYPLYNKYFDIKIKINKRLKNKKEFINFTLKEIKKEIKKYGFGKISKKSS